MSIFKKFFCLHEWVRADSYENPYIEIRFSVGSRAMCVCKKCGKVALYPDY